MSAADPTPAGTGPGEPSAAIAASIRTAFAAASKRDRDHLRARQSAVSYRDGFTLQLEQIVEAWDRAEAVALGALRAAPVAADARPADVDALAHALRYLPDVELHNDPAVVAADLLARVGLPSADARPEAGEPSDEDVARLRTVARQHLSGGRCCVDDHPEWLDGLIRAVLAARAATPPGAASGTRDDVDHVNQLCMTLLKIVGKTAMEINEIMCVSPSGARLRQGVQEALRHAAL